MANCQLLNLVVYLSPVTHSFTLLVAAAASMVPCRTTASNSIRALPFALKPIRPTDEHGLAFHLANKNQLNFSFLF